MIQLNIPCIWLTGVPIGDCDGGPDGAWEGGPKLPGGLIGPGGPIGLKTIFIFSKGHLVLV